MKKTIQAQLSKFTGIVRNLEFKYASVSELNGKSFETFAIVKKYPVIIDLSKYVGADTRLVTELEVYLDNPLYPPKYSLEKTQRVTLLAANFGFMTTTDDLQVFMKLHDLRFASIGEMLTLSDSLKKTGERFSCAVFLDDELSRYAALVFDKETGESGLSVLDTHTQYILNMSYLFVKNKKAI